VIPDPNFDASSVATLSGATSYRIISAGFKLKRISPSLTTSGMVFVRSYGIDAGSEIPAFSGNSYSASQTVDVPLVDAHDLCFIHEHTAQMPQVFYNFGVNALSVATTNGFCPATVFVQGAPASTPILQLEYVMHVEYVFDTSAPLALAATPAPPSNQIVTQVAARISSSAQGFFYDTLELAGKTIRQKALGYLTSALSLSPNPGLRMIGSMAGPITVD
jgi:hypothetical protein